jgi:hypothetical protein
MGPLCSGRPTLAHTASFHASPRARLRHPLGVAHEPLQSYACPLTCACSCCCYSTRAPRPLRSSTAREPLLFRRRARLLPHPRAWPLRAPLLTPGCSPPPGSCTCCARTRPARRLLAPPCVRATQFTSTSLLLRSLGPPLPRARLPRALARARPGPLHACSLPERLLPRALRLGWCLSSCAHASSSPPPAFCSAQTSSVQAELRSCACRWCPPPPDLAWPGLLAQRAPAPQLPALARLWLPRPACASRSPPTRQPPRSWAARPRAAGVPLLAPMPARLGLRQPPPAPAAARSRATRARAPRLGPPSAAPPLAARAPLALALPPARAQARPQPPEHSRAPRPRAPGAACQLPLAWAAAQCRTGAARLPDLLSHGEKRRR